MAKASWLIRSKDGQSTVVSFKVPIRTDFSCELWFTWRNFNCVGYMALRSASGGLARQNLEAVMLWCAQSIAWLHQSYILWSFQRIPYMKTLMGATPAPSKRRLFGYLSQVSARLEHPLQTPDWNSGRKWCGKTNFKGSKKVSRCTKLMDMRFKSIHQSISIHWELH